MRGARRRPYVDRVKEGNDAADRPGLNPEGRGDLCASCRRSPLPYRHMAAGDPPKPASHIAAVAHVPIDEIGSNGGAARRRFLKGAAAVAGGAGLAAFPMVAVAQSPIVLRFQGAWSARDIFHEYALDYARRVIDMTGGRVRIEVLAAGAVVKPQDLLDAVSKGALDGCHATPALWAGRNSAFSLFGAGPAIGMDANQLLAWVR